MEKNNLDADTSVFGMHPKDNIKNLSAGFENTVKELIQVLSSFGQEEMNTVPFESSWTAGQVGEHLLKSYFVVETLNGKVQQTQRDPEEKVEKIKALFLNFDVKLNSPEFILPSNNTIEKQSLLSSLEKVLTQIGDVIKTKEPSETCLDYAIPQFGEFTRLEWINFVIVHTQRHIRQLKGIYQKLQTR
ncbi:DinB family protein [Rubrolithibacter danxiaensis]|uniref:DinB family protein n=1 Tax=Rubrolithibacter danxiaensis TaxID=3390805 RepID=UPI003BF9269D